MLEAGFYHIFNSFKRTFTSDCLHGQILNNDSAGFKIIDTILRAFVSKLHIKYIISDFSSAS